MMPEKLSTASTALQLTLDQQDKLLLWPGHSSASRLTLPNAEAGLTFNIFFQADAVSSATKILAKDTDDFFIEDGSTDRGAGVGSTIEGGVGITVIAIDNHRWIADRFGASTVALTAISS